MASFWSWRIKKEKDGKFISTESDLLNHSACGLSSSLENAISKIETKCGKPNCWKKEIDKEDGLPYWYARWEQKYE